MCMVPKKLPIDQGTFKYMSTKNKSLKLSAQKCRAKFCEVQTGGHNDFRLFSSEIEETIS